MEVQENKYIGRPMLLIDERPKLDIEIMGKRFSGLMEIGDDVSMIATKHWLCSWPLKSVPTVKTGIGTMIP